MSRRTHTWNAWQATITAELASGANSVSVAAIPAEFIAPMYLVVEPDQTGQKEWIKAGTINGNTFENLTRGLDGSDGDLTHPINSVIRLVISKQHIDDLFLDVGDLETADSDHIADASDPHAAAGYLIADSADFVAVIGDTMTGDLTLPGDPDADLKAATKKYVDDVSAAFLPLVGGTLTGDVTIDVTDAGLHLVADNGDVFDIQMYDAGGTVRFVYEGEEIFSLNDVSMGMNKPFSAQFGLNMVNSVLSQPADPTAGNEVGDVDFNDFRYGTVSTGDDGKIRMASIYSSGSVASGTTLDGILTLPRHPTLQSDWSIQIAGQAGFNASAVDLRVNVDVGTGVTLTVVPFMEDVQAPASKFTTVVGTWYAVIDPGVGNAEIEFTTESSLSAFWRMMGTGMFSKFR